MQGPELIKNLAQLDQDLTAKVEEARRVAAQRIKSATEKSRRLLAEAEVKVRQMAEDWKIRVAQERTVLEAEARGLAAKEKERLRSQAEPNIDRAVAFILQEVMP